MTGRGLGKWGRGVAVGAIACAGFPLALLPSWADTLEGALVQAYQNNPTLNSQRASVRATDEGVPQALSGYRPRVTVNGSIGHAVLGPRPTGPRRPTPNDLSSNSPAP